MVFTIWGRVDTEKEPFLKPETKNQGEGRPNHWPLAILICVVPSAAQMPNLLAVLLAGIYILQASASNQKQYDEPFVIAGYWPNYRTYINIVQTSSQILTDIIIFSIEPQATKSIINDDVCCIGKEQYAEAREARRKSHNSSMNLFVSIGGGGRSSAMKEISASKERRMAFIRDLKALWCVAHYL